jgi:hypothetical protein
MLFNRQIVVSGTPEIKECVTVARDAARPETAEISVKNGGA